MQVTVIIVNYKVPHYLLFCLHTLQRALQTIESEIIVVDNASVDDSEALVRQHFPQVQWLGLPKNIGFAKANNVALQQAKGNYTVFVNPDTLVPENLFTHTLNHAIKYPILGVLGVQLIDGSGQFLPESKREKPTILGSFFKVAGLAEKYPTHRWWNKYALGQIPNQADVPVDILPGAFMLGSTHVLQKIGGFDERYFMYGEDIDLCVTMLQAGYDNWYLGSQKLIHFKGESTVKSSASYAEYFFGAMLLYVKKHYAAWYYKPITQILTWGVNWAKNRQKTNPKTCEPAAIAVFYCIGSLASFQALKQAHLHIPLQLTQTLSTVPKNADIMWLIGVDFGVADAIEMMCAHSGQYNFYWYYAHAPAIVGSSSKHVPGRVIITSKTLQ
ncbi:MAG: glycosyltransferase family 2 protein [Bacteroidetes bacterium]|nr:MAG: glycosyltransferase family 2 protein [Bacteroidota bacterium]